MASSLLEGEDAAVKKPEQGPSGLIIGKWAYRKDRGDPRQLIEAKTE